MADEFVPGRELRSAFYAEVVSPPLGHRRHSAALLGWGSDLLGFDAATGTTATSKLGANRDSGARLPRHRRTGDPTS